MTDGRTQTPPPSRLPFFSDCVSWPSDRLAELEYLVDNGRAINVDWFARNVEIGNVEGYWLLSLLVSDHRKGVDGTSFYRLPGKPVFWLVNSMIEYVFATEATIAVLLNA